MCSRVTVVSLSVCDHVSCYNVRSQNRNYSSAGILCLSLLVVAVSGTSYNVDNAFLAAEQVDTKSCAVTGLLEVCHSAEFGSDRVVHVCPKDGPCDQTLCYHSTVRPCCADAVGLQCRSTSRLLVEGKTINVTYNQIALSGEICVSFSPAVELCDDTCERTCPRIDCEKNVECDSNGANCACLEGYSPESQCCNCTEGYHKADPDDPNSKCIKFCRENCIGLGPCSSCRGGFVPPECCDCPPGRVERNGVCECPINVNTDGTCKNGALAPDCCECDTTGRFNTTHAFYKSSTGECKPFCKNNCAETGSSGCRTCKTGFITAPECCRCEPGLREINGECKSDHCDKQQIIYFYIDATSSNHFNNFCPLMVLIQMLVAAINPSSTSGTKTSALLFSDPGRKREPSPVFDIGTSCFDAVNNSLLSLIREYEMCELENREYDSVKFPSLCGEGTVAVPGLREIYRRVSATDSSIESDVIMVTDGIITDDPNDVEKVLDDLKSARMNTLIAAGMGNAKVINMERYTSSDNVLVGNDPVELGLAIVNRMAASGMLCQEHADEVITSLRNARGGQLIQHFCSCNQQAYMNLRECTRKYPTCNGDISIGLPEANLPSSKAQDIEALESESLEDEILAAIEDVLERHNE